MANPELLVKLRELHDVLVGINDDLRPSERVDEQTIDALGQLVTDLGELADRIAIPGDEAPMPEQEHRELIDRINAFEARHPRVTQFLNQLADALTMIGI